jgi:TonB-linked SusC/RagA family outer membrane protein
MKRFLFCWVFCLLTTISAYSETKTLSIDVRDANLEEVFKAIEGQSAYKFSYRNVILDPARDIVLKMDDASLGTILNEVLPPKGLKFEVAAGNSVVITKAEKTKQTEIAKPKDKITGRVVTDTAEPIIGASVIVKGTLFGGITDLDGRFSIDAPLGSTLDISYLGYASIEVKADRTDIAEIVLHEDVQKLEEVVVVGYGTQKKVNLTGSVASVSAADIASRPITNVASGLQGMLSGVTIVNATGQPGQSDVTIRVRGMGTLGNANPLVLIDGVEGDMNTLNPDDVQSVSVLKDAASSAIYGARAANGVLLITTKKPEQDRKPTITLGGYFGFQLPTRLPQMASALEYMELENEAKRNVGTSIAWFPEVFDKVKNGTDPNYFGNTDWISEVIRSYAPQQSYNVGINGTVGKSGYMLSYRYLDQKGLTKGASSGETRNNIRFKVYSQLLDRILITSNVGYVLRDITEPINSFSSGGGAIYNAMRIQPNVPVRYTDGTWAYGGGNTNPVAILYDGGRNKGDYDEISLLENIKIDIVKGWDVSATYSFVQQNSLRESIAKTIIFKNPEKAGTDNEVEYTYNNPNSVRNTDYRRRQQTLIVQTNFDFTFGRHNLSGVGGVSQEWQVMRQFWASRTNLVTEHDPTLNLGSGEAMSNNSNASQWAIRSGFGRVNYNYDDRYLVEMNLRYDLSSRFAKAVRGGLFPSFSAAWRLSEEQFMAFSHRWLDNLKLRASWGMLGNQYVGTSEAPYLSALTGVSSGLSLIGTLPTTGYTQTVLSNPGLTWEKIDMLDVGFDIALFKNRLNVTFDWYNKNTKGILLSLNYPSQMGAKAPEENVGAVNNRGWDIDLSWRDRIGEVRYGVNVNLSDVRNKITDLGNTAPDLSTNRIRRVGDPIDAFYGYIAEGLMMPEDFDVYDDYSKRYMSPNIPVVIGNDYQPGDIKYRDISGPNGVPDGRISPEYDRVVIGSSIPRYTYNIRGEVEWKGIDFALSLQGVGKNNGFLEGTARHAFQDMAAYPQKVHLKRFNIETNPNPNAAYPRLTHNTGFNQNTFSTYWLEDASYLRLKNIQLGYTFPKEWTSKAHIDKLRVYVSADNLFTATNFFYAYDPETPVSKGGYYPQVKTIVFGFNVTFQ